MKDDRAAYLELVAVKLRAQNLAVTTQLALGNPPAEILKVAAAENCNLIAMTSHGHRFFRRPLPRQHHHQVRHKTIIPILALRRPEKISFPENPVTSPAHSPVDNINVRRPGGRSR